METIKKAKRRNFFVFGWGDDEEGGKEVKGLNKGQ
jgi:hypothetical protein